MLNHPKKFEQFLHYFKHLLLVFEASGSSGWVVELARKPGV